MKLKKKIKIINYSSVARGKYCPNKKNCSRPACTEQTKLVFDEVNVIIEL